MTMLAPVLFWCDMPANLWLGHVGKCSARFDSRCTKTPEARRAAKEAGWRHLAGHDFCSPAGDDDNPHGKDHASYGSLPKLTGQDLPPHGPQPTEGRP